MANPVRRVAAIAAATALAIGFGGGFLAAKVLPGGAKTPGAQAADSGFAWPSFGKPRDPRAPRAGVKKPEGFAVWTSRLDTSRAEPAACIRMTRQLDPRRSYGDFVTVEPDLGHPAAVTARNDELCVAGVGFEGRKVTLLHGLQAASGEVLTADAVVEFSQGAKPAFVGFSGDGVILPREDSDGVGLETVNVTKLRVEVWRVADRNLVRKSISAPTPTEEGGYAEDYGADSVGEDGRQVWTGTMDVHGQPDQRATTVFPLGAVLKTLQPGAYVVKAVDASGLKGTKKKDGEPEGPTPAQARRWILFTDMALQAYDGSDALDVTVRSLKTAKAMAGVRVALVGKDGADLASAQSDATGRVHFAQALLAGEAGAKPARVMAYGPKADFTTLDLERAPVDLSKQDIGGRDAPGGAPQTGKSALDAAAVVDGFLYADRGVYRPGETVHLVGLLRDHLAHAVKDRHGALVVKRPSGLEFRRVRFEQTPNGAVAQDLVLPAGAPRGRWTAAIQMDGSDAPSGDVSFQVEDFVPQRLAVTIAADQARPVVGNEVRKVQVEARFLYGATAAGLPVQAEARVREDTDPFPALKGYEWGDQQAHFDEKLIQSPASTTDGQGHAIETLDTTELMGAGMPLTATFSASVFEPGGRPVSEQAVLKVRTKPLYLGVKTSSSGTGDTPTQSFDVVAVRPEWPPHRRARGQLHPDRGELELRLVRAERALVVAAHQPRHADRQGRAERHGRRAGPLQQAAGLGRLPAGAGGPGDGRAHRGAPGLRLGRGHRGRRGAGHRPRLCGEGGLQDRRYRGGAHPGAFRGRGAGGGRGRPADCAEFAERAQGGCDRAVEGGRGLGRRGLCAGQRGAAARPGLQPQAAPGAGPGLRAARREGPQAHGRGSRRPRRSTASSRSTCR